jgi:hypothetical protein
VGYHPAWTDPESHRREGKRARARARGGKEAFGSRAAAVCVISRGVWGFSSFSCQGPCSPAIGESTFWVLLQCKAATKVTVDNGKVREGGEGGSGAASVYSIAIAASLPNVG